MEKIKSAKFVKSSTKKENLFVSNLNEYAFVGRSNCGKSSLINSLCGIKNLAKASSTPGRTRLINYFEINSQILFVDLPGYGFSKAGKGNEGAWGEMMEGYFLNNKNLKLVFVLLDCRHAPTKNDKLMLNFLYQNLIPFKIIATKCDKIAKTKIAVAIKNIANSVGVGSANILPYSILEEKYKNKILDIID